MVINRVWAMPNKWTFKIKPIKELLDRYVGDGIGWVDPFAGMYSPAEFTNDLNPEMPVKYHLHARDFVESLNGQRFNGIIFDPPYSLRQVKECYDKLGVDMSFEDSKMFPTHIKNIIAPKIENDGIAISCGWDTIGFGVNRGFELIEILLVCHGGRHNDTIITVERKQWQLI